MYKGKIPFDKSGRVLNYIDGYTTLQGIVWHDNFVFFSKMKIIDARRGRSAIRFIVKDDNGQEYNMFLIDMLYVMKNIGISKHGIIPVQHWTFCKRGCNYGITINHAI